MTNVMVQMKKILLKKLIFLPLAFLFISQTSAQDLKVGQNSPDVLEIRLIPTVTFQAIEHFGASGAWSAQFVGL